MKISVVIPTCAREELLARCLGPIVAVPSSDAAEIVVTDDGTNDNTREMLRTRFPQVRWMRGPRRGPAANRNYGASQSSGEFIVFIDDDVVPSSDLVVSYGAAISEAVNVYEGRTTCVAGLNSPLDVSPVNETGGWLWSCNLMIRRSFWERLGGFDEAFRFPHMEDVAFRERLQAMNERVVFVPTAVVDHPPRRLRSARTRIQQQESYFIYNYKYLGQRPSRLDFVRQQMGHYLRVVARTEKGLDSIVTVGSLFWEIAGVLKHWRQWSEQYQHLAKDPVRTESRRSVN